MQAKRLKTARRISRVQRDRASGLTIEIPCGYEDLIFEVFGRRCASCAAQEKIVLDHHRPLQQGHGLLHNAVPLCLSCNRRKKNKPPEVFYGPWKFTEILVGLHETRNLFEERFGPCEPTAREAA